MTAGKLAHRGPVWMLRKSKSGESTQTLQSLSFAQFPVVSSNVHVFILVPCQF